MVDAMLKQKNTGRLKLRRPFATDGKLMAFSAGVFNSEGFYEIAWGPSGSPFIQLGVSACDKGMIAKVAEAWGTKAFPSRAKRPICNPDVFPDSFTRYYAKAGGSRAFEIIRRYREEGLLSAEKEMKLKMICKRHPEAWNF